MSNKLVKQISPEDLREALVNILCIHAIQQAGGEILLNEAQILECGELAVLIERKVSEPQAWRFTAVNRVEGAKILSRINAIRNQTN